MQKATLYEAVNMIRLGAMPLPQFVTLHPDAKVTLEVLQGILLWLIVAVGSPSLIKTGMDSYLASKF